MHLDQEDDLARTTGIWPGCFGYQGQAWLEIRSGDSQQLIHWSRMRLYSPELGRFLQIEPSVFRRVSNHYLYCSDNPVQTVDPLGLQDENSHDMPTSIWEPGRPHSIHGISPAARKVFNETRLAPQHKGFRYGHSDYNAAVREEFLKFLGGENSGRKPIDPGKMTEPQAREFVEWVRDPRNPRREIREFLDFIYDRKPCPPIPKNAPKGPLPKPPKEHYELKDIVGKRRPRGPLGLPAFDVFQSLEPGLPKDFRVLQKVADAEVPETIWGGIMQFFKITTDTSKGPVFRDQFYFYDPSRHNQGPIY